MNDDPLRYGDVIMVRYIKSSKKLLADNVLNKLSKLLKHKTKILSSVYEGYLSSFG